MNKRPSVAGNFDGHGGAPMQYRAHHQMQHDQGFTGSYRTPPSGDYLLRIAPAAARVTINAMKMQYVPTLLAVLMAIAIWQCYTACITQWRRFVAFIKATKRQHWAGTCSDITQHPDTQCRLILTFHREKRLQLIVRMSDCCLQGIEPCECKGKGHQWVGNQVFR